MLVAATVVGHAKRFRGFAVLKLNLLWMTLVAELGAAIARAGESRLGRQYVRTDKRSRIIREIHRKMVSICTFL